VLPTAHPAPPEQLGPDTFTDWCTSDGGVSVTRRLTNVDAQGFAPPVRGMIRRGPTPRRTRAARARAAQSDPRPVATTPCSVE